MGSTRTFATFLLVISAATLLLNGTTTAHASPWPRDKNGLLIISRVDYFKADLASQTPPESGRHDRFQRFESNTYLEFGLTHNTTIGGKVVYGTSWLTRGDFAETTSGFSEIEFFAQQQIARTPKHVISIKSSVAAPSRFQSGVRTELASDGIDVELSALYGRNITSRPFKIFAAAEAGFQKRVSDSADQIRTQFTFGAEPTRKILLLAEVLSEISLQNEKNDGADFDIVKFQPSVTWQVTRNLRLQAGITEEVAGRNIDLGRTYFLGFWTEF